MSIAQPNPCAPDAPRPDLKDRILERMLQIGLKRLDSIERQYEAAATDEAFAAADVAYTSVTRSLRLTMAFAKRRKAEAERRARESAAEAEAAAAERTERGRR